MSAVGGSGSSPLNPDSYVPKPKDVDELMDASKDGAITDAEAKSLDLNDYQREQAESQLSEAPLDGSGHHLDIVQAIRILASPHPLSTAEEAGMLAKTVAYPFVVATNTINELAKLLQDAQRQ